MMSHAVEAIVAVAGAHAPLTYALAFLLAGAESFPVIGALVPGTAAIVAFGALVPTGAIGFWPLLLATTAGAVAGDGLPYWFGHRYKERAAATWPLRRHPGLIAAGEAFFARHGGKAIVIARFTPGVRAIVPLVAGIARMPAARFYSMNVLSSLLWAPAHVVMGVLIGESLTVLGAVAGRLAVLVLAVFLLLASLVWLTPRVVRWIGRHAARLDAPLRAWADGQNTWPRRQVRALLDPDRTGGRALAVLGALLIGSLWLLFGAIQDLLAGDPLVLADRAALHMFQALRVEWADRLAVAVLAVGSVGVTVAVAAVAVVWLAARRAWPPALYVTAAVAGAVAFAAAFGVALRLPAGIAPGPGFGALSGAAVAAAVAFYVFLAVLVAQERGGRVGLGTITAAVVLTGLIAFARLYLGADRLSTVLAAAAFGLAWAALLGIANLARPRRRLGTGGLLASALVALLLAGGVSVAATEQADLDRYAVAPAMRTMALAEWWRGGWAGLPARRLDLLGSYRQPFTVEWAGGLFALSAALDPHGWRAPVPWTWRSALEFLAPQADPASLPVLPRLESGRPEALVLIRTGSDLPAGERLVLRLWRSDVRLSLAGAHAPLWLGGVTAQRVGRAYGLVTTTRDVAVPARTLARLAAALPLARLQRRAAADAGAGGGVLLAAAPDLAPGIVQDAARR